ncbi:17863_t:CDS:2 [Rhizophagus irregularis]|nr:17863_t:CDS:2 [Rhizophagus irregularis]
MSNQENNNKSNSSDANNSTDKGKAKFISAISNSANELIRETLIPSSGTKSHMYPFHHHYPHKTNLINENFEDGNEIIGFLNSNDYTNQVYNEEFNQTTLNGKEDSKFILEEFLENEDIEKYLLKTTYTDDVYGIPKFLKKLIIEAKNELNNNKNDQDENITLKHQRTAIERLKMM